MSSNYLPRKLERLEARLSFAQKELIQHAADLMGRSLSDFVISSTQEAARQVIREHKIIALTTKESKNLVHVLVNPPDPNTALEKAQKQHKKLLDK